jgi:hypothetical protein
MKVFKGVRTQDGCKVTVNGRPLNPRTDLFPHSRGYDWAYLGSGPAQLALGLVSSVLGRGKDNDRRAISVYQIVKETLLLKLPKEGWVLQEYEIDMAIREAEMERKYRSMKG